MSELTPAVLNQTADNTSPTSAGFSGMSRLRALWSDAVLRKGMLSVFDQAVVSGTSFVTSVLIGRLCSPQELGVYYLALSVVLFIRGIQEQIISAPFSVYCHRHRKEELAAYTGSALAHEGLLLLVTVAGLSVGAVVFSGDLLADVVPGGLPAAAVWAVVGAAPFLLFREYLRQLVFARLALRTAILLDVAVAVVQLGGLALLALFDRLTVGNAYLVMGGACATAALGWWSLPREPVRLQRSRIVPDWKRNWKFSRWALASHLVGCSTPYLLPWFVAAVDGTAATGILAACNTLVGLANAFMMGLGNYLTPKSAQSFAAGGIPALRSVLRKTLILFGLSIGGFALVSVFAGNWMAVLIYGRQYAGAGPILAVLAFGLLAGSIGMTAGNGLWAIERPAANFRADVCALMATVVSAALLTPPYGVLGAALSSLIGAATDAGIRCWILFRLMREMEHSARFGPEEEKPA